MSVSQTVAIVTHIKVCVGGWLGGCGRRVKAYCHSAEINLTAYRSSKPWLKLSATTILIP